MTENSANGVAFLGAVTMVTRVSGYDLTFKIDSLRELGV